MVESLMQKSYFSDSDHLVDPNGPDRHLNACIGPQILWGKENRYYSDGFRLAADRLVEELKKGGTVNLPVDVVVYPVFFLYRHHLELQLKDVIVTCHLFVHREEHPYPHGHNLMKLWSKARPLIESSWPELDWSQNRIVTNLIVEFTELDPNGEAGRYPISKSEKTFKDTPILNVPHFARMAVKLSEFFSHIVFTVDQMAEWRAEMERHGVPFERRIS